MKTCPQAYADSAGPNQPVHLHSLIRAFAVCKQDHCIIQNVSLGSKGPDETLRICWHILRMLYGTFSLDRAQIYDRCLIVLRLIKFSAPFSGFTCPFFHGNKRKKKYLKVSSVCFEIYSIYYPFDISWKDIFFVVLS